MDKDKVSLGLALLFVPAWPFYAMAWYYGHAVAKDRKRGPAPELVYDAIMGQPYRTSVRVKRELTLAAVRLWSSQSRQAALDWAEGVTSHRPVFLNEFFA